MLKVVIVNGFPRSGKDAFVDMCIELAARKDFVGHSISSVDKVKEAAKVLGWDGLKDEKGRKFLSDLKDLSTLNYEGPMDYMTGKIDNRDRERKHIFFLHIREPHEISKFIHFYPETLTVCIHRIDSEKHYENTGDSSVLVYAYDRHIQNNGTLLDLEQEAIKFVEEVCV